MGLHRVLRTNECIVVEYLRGYNDVRNLGKGIRPRVVLMADMYNGVSECETIIRLSAHPGSRVPLDAILILHVWNADVCGLYRCHHEVLNRMIVQYVCWFLIPTGAP